MSDLGGEWDVTIQTPMGEQSFLFDVRVDGQRFSGHASGELGSLDFDDGVIDGDALSWSMRVKKPFPMTLAVRATLSGDAIEGIVDAGMMGAMPMAGTRRA